MGRFGSDVGGEGGGWGLEMDDEVEGVKHGW